MTLLNEHLCQSSMLLTSPSYSFLMANNGEGMHCRKHPYRGGICALCLQDKLGKLVFSSSSSFLRSSTSSSNSPSPSFKPQLPALIPPPSDTVLGRSKSTSTTRDECTSRKKRSFWSFLYNKSDKPKTRSSGEGNNVASFVSRSRSLGCRNHSNFFFNRISTGFGDCRLRRAETQQEAFKPRVPCAGLFSGFIRSSLSSSWPENSTGNTKNAPTNLAVIPSLLPLRG